MRVPFEAIRTTTADHVFGVDVVVRAGMEEYSGWDYLDHLRWIGELTGLDTAALILLVGSGYLVMTNEMASEVWLVSNDHYKSTARLIYDESAIG